ncbi:MAG: hypothetical protein AAGL24_28890 [Pseudomonadota bacterium]
MAGTNEMQGLRAFALDSSSRTSSDDQLFTWLFIAAPIAMVASFAVALIAIWGTNAVLYPGGKMQADVRQVLDENNAVKIVQDISPEMTLALKACARSRRLARQGPDASTRQAGMTNIDQRLETILQGTTNAQAIQCLARSHTENLCDGPFRAGFVELVRSHRKANVGLRRIFLPVTGAGAEAERSSEQIRNDPVNAAVLSLLTSGHLQRSDFNDSILGEPDWIFAIGGARVFPSRPC